jgi:hypothetical protein
MKKIMIKFDTMNKWKDTFSILKANIIPNEMREKREAKNLIRVQLSHLH